jgi:hypothetical protein
MSKTMVRTFAGVSRVRTNNVCAFASHAQRTRWAYAETFAAGINISAAALDATATRTNVLSEGLTVAPILKVG